MKALIIGATGFIGRELIRELTDAGHQPVAVSRNPGKAEGILGKSVEIAGWDGKSIPGLAMHLEQADAIINLAGENIAAGRWTEKRKEVLAESRIRPGQAITEALRLASARPRVLIQGSAIGIYGISVENPADEKYPAGSGFVAGLTKEWELSVEPAQELVSRIVWIRTGLVLGKGGGLMEKMLLPFRFYAGTVLGTGRQWMSWIHINDEVRAIRFLLENEKCAGYFNLTAPSPVRMKEFMHLLGKETGKPVLFKVPGILLRAALGEMARETVLASQNIFPGKLLNEGFQFKYPDLQGALHELLQKNIKR